MSRKITCFLPYTVLLNKTNLIADLNSSPLVDEIVLLHSDTDIVLPLDCRVLKSDSLFNTETIRSIAANANSDYVLLYTQTQDLKLGAYALERMLKVAEDVSVGMLYSDFYKIKEGVQTNHPLIDYQEGSLRDDFDFGPLLLIETKALKEAVERMQCDYRFAALYDLRLKLSEKTQFFRLPEYLYTVVEDDLRKSGEKIFDYVDPKNRAVQLEMEQACTEHLKATGAWLKPEFKEIHFTENYFPVEATVVIPVRNREKTIEDAVRSVLQQETSFDFNIIVVDNHSTDQTKAILSKMAAEDKRLLHIIPERSDLGIGGCWNTAVMHPACGKFAIQLDSDDLYIDAFVLEEIVKAFYEQNCAMVVGSYKMVNFNLEEIPPGLIDHKEWTPDNGRNNALRINGLGAPRAFYTPILRALKIPNTSYGEDYAIGLAISREYQIGRIYDPLYLCRRWEDNSDAALDINKMNGHNLYKDRIRTIEYLARIKKNQQLK